MAYEFNLPKQMIIYPNMVTNNTTIQKPSSDILDGPLFNPSPIKTLSQLEVAKSKTTPEPLFSFFQDMWTKKSKEYAAGIIAIDQKLNNLAIQDTSSDPYFKMQNELLKKSLTAEKQTLINAMNNTKENVEFAKILMEDPKKIPTESVVAVAVPQITNRPNKSITDEQLKNKIALAEKNIDIDNAMQSKEEILALKLEQNIRANLKAGIPEADATKMASMQKEIDLNKFNALLIQQKRSTLAYQAQAGAENYPELAPQYAELDKKLANEKDISVANVKNLETQKAELKAKYEKIQDPIIKPPVPNNLPSQEKLMQIIMMLLKLLMGR